VAQMRADYLFELAYHCHIPPTQVDDMTVIDFARFIKGIDQLRAEIAAANKGD
jgi:hypothetical protein